MYSPVGPGTRLRESGDERDRLLAARPGIVDRAGDHVGGLLGLWHAHHRWGRPELHGERAVVGALLVAAAVGTLTEAPELNEPEEREVAADGLVPVLLEAVEVRVLVGDSDRRVVGDQEVGQQPEVPAAGQARQVEG